MLCKGRRLERSNVGNIFGSRKVDTIKKERAMNTKLLFGFGLMILFLSTCSMDATPADSGLEGQVLIGPMCAVVQVGQECPDQPYQATLTINSPNGRKIVQ